MTEDGTPRSVPPSSRQRPKPQLSCNLCRRRKLKCDRQQPCENCVSRGLGASCEYATSTTQIGTRAQQHAKSSAARTSVSDRIEQLEGLVVSLMASQKDVVTPQNIEEKATDPKQLMGTFGRLSLQPSESVYVGNSHWLAILDSIQELKGHFEKHPIEEPFEFIQSDEPDCPKGIDLLYYPADATQDEVLAALPPRPMVDRMVSRYFRGMDMAPLVIHMPTFFKEYERFWADPKSTPIMWVGLLYCVLCLANTFDHFAYIPLASEPTCPSRDGSEAVNFYRRKVVECLKLGRYTSPGRYTVQTLMLYFSIEYFRSEDTQMGAWVLLSIIMRVALRMGLHRDPSHFPQITPFYAEMRRRIWSTVAALDLSLSFQIGLPRMIRDSDYDTLRPRNLIDSDFDEDTVELPPSRPDHESTPLLYAIQKHKWLTTFSKIVDATTAPRPCPYTEVICLQKLLDDTKASIPEALRNRPMSHNIMDAPDIVIQRVYLDICYNRGSLMLHRKFMFDPHHPNSRQVCIDAGIIMLEHQHVIHEEIQPGGQVFQMRWKVSSLVNFDFLQATTILCLIADEDLKRQESASKNATLSDSPAQAEPLLDRTQRQRIIRTLTRTYQIWLLQSRSSREARKAAEALEIVLRKVNRHAQTQHEGAFNTSPESSNGVDEHITPAMTSPSSNPWSRGKPDPLSTSPWFTSTPCGIPQPTTPSAAAASNPSAFQQPLYSSAGFGLSYAVMARSDPASARNALFPSANNGATNSAAGTGWEDDSMDFDFTAAASGQGAGMDFGSQWGLNDLAGQDFGLNGQAGGEELRFL